MLNLRNESERPRVLFIALISIFASLASLEATRSRKRVTIFQVASNDASIMKNVSVDSSQSKQRITTTIIAVLATIFVLMRIMTRRGKAMALGTDDWTLITGLVWCPRRYMCLELPY
jgi:hypothetical protein